LEAKLTSAVEIGSYDKFQLLFYFNFKVIQDLSKKKKSQFNVI